MKEKTDQDLYAAGIHNLTKHLGIAAGSVAPVAGQKVASTQALPFCSQMSDILSLQVEDFTPASGPVFPSFSVIFNRKMPFPRAFE